MQEHTNIQKGVWYALLTALISGIAIAYSKSAVARIDPLLLTTSRNLYVAVLFFALLVIRGQWEKIKSLRSSDIRSLLLIGMLGGFLPFFLFFSGLQYVSAPVANVIHKTLFLWVTLLSVFILKEKLRLSYIVSYAAIIAGTFLFIPVSLSPGKGEQLIFAATILWSIEYLIAKRVLRTVSPNIVGLFRMGVGSLLLSSVLIATKGPGVFASYNPSALVTIGIGGSLLFFYVFFWYRALKYAPASLVSLMLSFSTAVGLFINGSLLGLNTALTDGISILLIGCGIFWILVHVTIRRVAENRLS